MVKTLRVILLIILVLFNPITGLIFGLLSFNGAFVRWHSLGKPPEVPTRILAADVRDTGVAVETVSGQIYECCFGSDLSSWAKRSPNEVQENNIPGCLDEKDRGKHLRNEIDNYAVSWCGEFDYGNAYYAIGNDNNVWVWKHSGVFPDWVIQLCIYPGVGIIISLVVFVFIRMTTKRLRNL